MSKMTSKKMLGLGAMLAVASVNASAAFPPLPEIYQMFFATTATGIQNIPPVFLPAVGKFSGKSNTTGLSYNLNVQNLSSAVTKVHIHFAQPFAAGGVLVNLCDNANANMPCSKFQVGNSISLAGTITSANSAALIPGIPTQGVGPGSWPQLLTAIRDGNAYLTVHTANLPAGEIRGQILKTTPPIPTKFG